MYKKSTFEDYVTQYGLLNIITPYGDHYQVDKNMNLFQKGQKPSEQWKFVGLKRVNSNMFIYAEWITPKLLNEIQILYKNGHPRWTVIDLDHGTKRIWGNTIYHGVKYIYFNERKVGYTKEEKEKMQS